MHGTWDTTMAVYEDESFTSVAGADYVVSVPDDIFIGIALQGAEGFVLRAKDCWITPGAADDSQTRYDILNDGCANELVCKNN